tara:strand:+ start:146 stop:1108 length:963 start_codon:yes stop_codon:yes gene_type:complete
MPTEVLKPVNQLSLYGYSNLFHNINNIFQNGANSKSILISGSKGLGKFTFAYHLANYLLSKNEEHSYSINNFKINEENKTYKLMQEGIHPNFFLLKNAKSEKMIKIDQVRDLITFTSKSTYSKGMKIVIIDNLEYFNLNALSALLKIIEEPPQNTYFFLINNSESKLLKTIKSRCLEFKVFFSYEKKKEVFNNLIDNYELKNNSQQIDNFCSFDTPGNLLKYFLMLSSNNIELDNDNLKLIIFYMDKYSVDKNPETLSILSLFIQKFYSDIVLYNGKNSLNNFINYSLIINYLHDLNKFTLDQKNVFASIKDILVNDYKS